MYPLKTFVYSICWLFIPLTGIAQQQITSMVTVNANAATSVSYLNGTGAGLKTTTNTLQSSWDSAVKNFTINYATGTNNITSISQYNVSGHAQPFNALPSSSLVKVRRLANAYVNDTRNHFNFWNTYSTIPAAAATSGTFNFIAPEITAMETAFLSNNINSGFDNIFQNSQAHLHADNVERVDFIIPSGISASASALPETGTAVFDRGTGDPFKIAAILSLDGNNDPLTYGPMVSVTAAQFGPDLKAAAMNYCIITHDPAFGNISRPSSPQSQNMRGVFLSFTNLGITAGQKVYGYSLFGIDVPSAVPDWTTYPNNSDSASQLDPITVMSIFKGQNAVLATPINFTVHKQNNLPIIQYEVFDGLKGDEISIERSDNGQDFTAINTQMVNHSGMYSYADASAATSRIFYRLKFSTKGQPSGYTEIRSIVSDETSIHIGPNPAVNFLNINLPSSWAQMQAQLTLYSTAGIPVLEENFIATGSKKLSLSSLPAGSYFLQVSNVKNGLTEKLPLLIMK